MTPQHPNAFPALFTSQTNILSISHEQFEAEIVGAKVSGLDLAPLFEQCGITADFLNNPGGRIPYRCIVQLRHTICRTLNDENVGFLETPVPWGTLAYLCRTLITSRTLKGVLNRYAHFHRMFRPGVECEVKELGSLAYIEFRVANSKGLDNHSFIENSLLFLLSFLLWLAKKNLVPKRIDYSFVEPGYAHDYAALVPCEYRFEQPVTQMVIDRNLLNESVKRKAEELNFFLNNHLYYLAEQNLAVGTLADRVRRIITSCVGINASISQVAKILNIPETTLRRRLKAEGYPFRELKETLRKDFALYYLLEKKLAVVDVAALMGYSEASAFSRAFKQWTGYAPQHHPGR